MYNQRRENTDYIFEDIQPLSPDINLEELEKIQKKLEDFTSSRSENGLTSEETEKFLDWVIYNARSYAVAYTLEPITTASMTGACATTQRINKELLTKLGLDVRVFNISECIGEVPMNEEDKRRVENGWFSHNVRHAITLVNMPIIDKNGNTQMHKFLLDPTFRQFCLKENCNREKFTDNEWLEHGHVAPHPGFFMQKENLVQLGETEEYANNSEWLCKTLIHNGYFYLNEQNAKLYGDAFVRASERLEFQNEPMHMSGKDYINNFENIQVNIYGSRDDDAFTRLPSEIIEYETGFFKKIIRFFKEKFAKKTKLLQSGLEIDNIQIPEKSNKLEEVKLNNEELANYRKGEEQVLKEYQNSLENREKDISSIQTVHEVH